jgi:uncharacterized alkaline shock family protein YloU
MVESKGSINVTDSVIKAIVGKCAIEVAGVSSLSGTIYQNLVSWGAQTETKGIDVRPGDDENSKRIDLHVTVALGQPIPTVAETLQRLVKEMVEKMTGLDVVEVNVFVDDVRPMPTTATESAPTEPPKFPQGPKKSPS